jgi:ribosomal protein S27E
MQVDPVLEGQRLSAQYRQMYDEELLQLARNFGDLTESAQWALQAEMLGRGLGDPVSPIARQRMFDPRRVPSAQSTEDPQAGATLHAGSGASQTEPGAAEASHEEDGLHEYTWKTPLCECSTREDAALLQEALRRAGIDSWIQFEGYTISFAPTTENRSTHGSMQILVAADQFDEARMIAAEPIPQEIVDELRAEIPEFVEPKCPKCGSTDVVLENVDPENTWRCEQCEAEWTETLPKADGGA